MATIAEFQGEKCLGSSCSNLLFQVLKVTAPNFVSGEGEIMRCLGGLNSGACDHGHTTVQFLYPDNIICPIYLLT